MKIKSVFVFLSLIALAIVISPRISNGVTDVPPTGNLDVASCSVVAGWAYDPDTTNGGVVTPPTNSLGCWQTPSAVTIDGYKRCQKYGSCTVGGVANSKCLDAMGNMEQPAGQDYCVAVSDLNDIDCNRSTLYTPPPATLSCTVIVNEPANALGINSNLGGSRVKGEQASADFSCQQLGYDSAQSDFLTKGWHSCGDNGIAYVSNGAWAYGNACNLGNSGIYYEKCNAHGSICNNVCGNGVLDPGEECDGNSSVRQDRCGMPTWYCSTACRMVMTTIDRNTNCP